MDFKRVQGKNQKVVYFFVHCLLCDSEKWIRGTSITKQRTSVCFCNTIKSEDRIGTTVKNFEILDFKRVQGKGQRATHFHLRCVLCGNEVWRYVGNVTGKKFVDCSCQKKPRTNEACRKDISGQTFGRLTAIVPTENRSGSRGIIWDCICSCGNAKQATLTHITSGEVKSCGCLINDVCVDNGNKSAEIFCVENTSLNSMRMKTSVNNTSGVKGVYFEKKTKKWRAQITFQGKMMYLGAFKDKEDAIKARKAAEEKYFEPILEKYKDRLNSLR